MTSDISSLKFAKNRKNAIYSFFVPNVKKKNMIFLKSIWMTLDILLGKGSRARTVWAYDFLIDYGPILPKNIGSILSDKSSIPPGTMPNRHFWISFKNYDLSSMSSWKFGHISVMNMFFTYEIVIILLFNTWLHKYPVWSFPIIK